MLQSIRDKITGWFAIIFLGAIAVVFIFWGVETGSNAGARYAATVNGQGIPLELVRKDWQSRERQLQQMMAGVVPDQMVKAQQAAILDEHIRRQLLTDHSLDGLADLEKILAGCEIIAALDDLDLLPAS